VHSNPARHGLLPTSSAAMNLGEIVNPNLVPDPAVKRLSLYLRQLESLAVGGQDKVSSRQLAESLGLTDAQVRKDLAYFGQFGRRGVGYRVAPLITQLRRILGTDKAQNVIVVGAGDLGRALLRYKGFSRKGFEFVAAFDVSESKVGRQFGGIPVYHIDQLPEVVRRHDVKLAVLTVPAEAAQETAERLCEAGIQGILNFAPAPIQLKPGVAFSLVDLAAQLEQLSFQTLSTKL